ncbi:MAG: DUF3276 family protein [Treponema sp.]|nr:DUF3276 family protein [Treponema sp.]
MGVRGELFSTKVSLQNRTYFFNVKENRLGDLYLNIVESKNRDEGGFDRQSVILFADDLQSFLQGFDEALRILEKAEREKRRGKSDARPRTERSSEERQPRSEGRERTERGSRDEHRGRSGGPGARGRVDRGPARGRADGGSASFTRGRADGGTRGPVGARGRSDGGSRDRADRGPASGARGRSDGGRGRSDGPAGTRGGPQKQGFRDGPQGKRDDTRRKKVVIKKPAIKPVKKN